MTSGHGPFAHFFDDHVLAAFESPPDTRRPAGKRLTHEDLSGRIIEDELGPLLRGLRRAPGAVAARDAFADDEAIDPAWVAFLVSKPALADPAMPQWVRWLQPLLSGVFTVDNLDYVRRDAYLTGRRDRPDRRRAAASLRVHLGARADPVRAGHPGARDVPHVTSVHLPAGLLPPDRAGDRPRPRRGVRAVDPGHLRRRLAGRSAGRLRRPRRVRAAPPGRPLGARRGAGSTARARRRDGDRRRGRGVAGDPAATSDVALGGRGPGRVRARRPAGGPGREPRFAGGRTRRDRPCRGRRPARPMRPRPTACSRSRRATARRCRSPPRSRRSRPTGSSPDAIGGADGGRAGSVAGPARTTGSAPPSATWRAWAAGRAAGRPARSRSSGPSSA